jgi:hypothetical protein
MTVSLVDMNILDSPASTIFVTNSEGTKYDIVFPLARLLIQVVQGGTREAKKSAITLRG